MGATAKLDGSLSTSRAGWVLLKCGDGNSDGHNPDRVRVGLVENSPEALDGLGDGEGGVLGEDLVIFTDHVVGDLEAELKSRSKSDFFQITTESKREESIFQLRYRQG